MDLTVKPTIARTMLVISIVGWIMNVIFLGVVSYKLFGAGFVCYPEGLPVQGDTEEDKKG